MSAFRYCVGVHPNLGSLVKKGNGLLDALMRLLNS